MVQLMSITLKFKPYDETLIDDAVTETERNQQLTIYQLPNYHVLFAIPTEMYEAFYNAVSPLLSPEQQQELLTTLGYRASAIAEQKDYEAFVSETEEFRIAA